MNWWMWLIAIAFVSYGMYRACGQMFKDSGPDVRAEACGWHPDGYIRDEDGRILARTYFLWPHSPEFLSLGERVKSYSEIKIAFYFDEGLIRVLKPIDFPYWFSSFRQVISWLTIYYQENRITWPSSSGTLRRDHPDHNG